MRISALSWQYAIICSANGLAVDRVGVIDKYDNLSVSGPPTIAGTDVH